MVIFQFAMLVITRWYFIDLKTAEVGTCWTCLTWISLKKGYNMGASCKFLKKKTLILYVISIYIYRYHKPKGIYKYHNTKSYWSYSKNTCYQGPPPFVSPNQLLGHHFVVRIAIQRPTAAFSRFPNQAQNGQTIQDRY